MARLAANASEFERQQHHTHLCRACGMSQAVCGLPEPKKPKRRARRALTRFLAIAFTGSCIASAVAYDSIDDPAIAHTRVAHECLAGQVYLTPGVHALSP